MGFPGVRLAKKNLFHLQKTTQKYHFMFCFLFFNFFEALHGIANIFLSCHGIMQVISEMAFPDGNIPTVWELFMDSLLLMVQKSQTTTWDGAKTL